MRSAIGELDFRIQAKYKQVDFSTPKSLIAIEAATKLKQAWDKRQS